MIKGINILNTEKNEFRAYCYEFGLTYLKWIPAPKAKLKALKIKSVKNPSFKNLLDIDWRNGEDLTKIDTI